MTRHILPAATTRTILGFLLTMARPYLRLYLWNYNRTMRQGIFPEQRMERLVPGPNSERVLFVGDIAVGGYGVLLDGMAFPAQTASIFASETGRGCSWEQITSFDLTAQRAATLIDDKASGIDVAVIALGIPDVLLVTGHAGWNTHIRELIKAIRVKAGCQSRIVLTGLPPMDRFQPLPPTIKHALALQVARLDGVSTEVASDLDNVVFVPFPVESFGKMYMRDAFSFRAMHHLWAAAIAPHLLDKQLDPVFTPPLTA